MWGSWFVKRDFLAEIAQQVWRARPTANIIHHDVFNRPGFVFFQAQVPMDEAREDFNWIDRLSWVTAQFRKREELAICQDFVYQFVNLGSIARILEVLRKFWKFAKFQKLLSVELLTHRINSWLVTMDFGLLVDCLVLDKAQLVNLVLILVFF